MKKVTYNKIDSYEDLEGLNVNVYEIKVGNRVLGTVKKLNSATRSYWFIDDAYNGKNTTKLKGKAYDYGNYDSFDQTRGGLVEATFPLELGVDPRLIQLERYKF